MEMVTQTDISSELKTVHIDLSSGNEFVSDFYMVQMCIRTLEAYTMELSDLVHWNRIRVGWLFGDGHFDLIISRKSKLLININ